MGIFGLAGGIGGFLLPIMFGALVDFTGVATSVWMLCFGVTLVSILWMWWTERRAPVLTSNRYHSPVVPSAAAAQERQDAGKEQAAVPFNCNGTAVGGDVSLRR